MICRFCLINIVPSHLKALFLVFMLISPLCSAATGDCLDNPLALINAKILTMDSADTQATALLIDGGKIRQVSPTEISTDDCTLYCTMSPCVSCMRSMWQAGITKVVTKELYGDFWSAIKKMEDLGVRLSHDGKYYELTYYQGAPSEEKSGNDKLPETES